MITAATLARCWALGLVSLALSGALVGCDGKGNADASASAASAAMLPQTCEASGAAYGKIMVAAVIDKVAAADKDKMAKALEAAVVKTCQEQKWDELTLSCLSGINKLSGEQQQRAADVCVKALPDDKEKKLDEALAAAVQSVKNPGFSGSAEASIPPAPTTPQGKAWALGHKIGLVAFARAMGQKGKAVDNGFAEAEALAQAFDFKLPPMPPMKNDKPSDVADALDYVLNKTGKPLTSLIATKASKEAALLFEMAFKSETLNVFYLGDRKDKLVDAATDTIKKSSELLKLPPELGRPLLEKIDKLAPPDDVSAAFGEWEKAVAEHLAKAPASAEPAASASAAPSAPPPPPPPPPAKQPNQKPPPSTGPKPSPKPKGGEDAL